MLFFFFFKTKLNKTLTSSTHLFIIISYNTIDIRKMSDGKLFTRSKTTELRTELEQAFKKSKPVVRVKVVLKKVLANIILNNHEVTNLMKDIIPLMKIVIWRLENYAVSIYLHMLPQTQMPKMQYPFFPGFTVIQTLYYEYYR